MTPIPDDIKQKIEVWIESGYNTINDGHFDTLEDLRDCATQDVEHGYSLAQPEIERLKGLLYKTFYAGKDFGVGEMKEWNGGYENEKPDYEQFKKDNKL